MRYRPEIDGLRALAVLPVIFHHAGFGLFSGGFVGVDVFFVISGYLITTIIHQEIVAGTFSLLTFYERRIRRIIPALFLVSIVCLPFAWAWLMPIELKDFGQSLIAVNLFASNILFWLEIDYFAPEAELKPLLHTWSLAVEEQFYVFFPLLLLLLKRFREPALALILLAISVASLALAQWAFSNRYVTVKPFLFSCHFSPWRRLVAGWPGVWVLFAVGRMRPPQHGLRTISGQNVRDAIWVAAPPKRSRRSTPPACPLTRPRSAVAGLRELGSGGGGCRRLQRFVEVAFVDEHGVQDHGELPGQRDERLLAADPSGERLEPGFQRRRPAAAKRQALRCFEEK